MDSLRDEDAGHLLLWSTAHWFLFPFWLAKQTVCTMPWRVIVIIMWAASFFWSVELSCRIDLLLLLITSSKYSMKNYFEIHLNSPNDRCNVIGYFYRRTTLIREFRHKHFVVLTYFHFSVGYFCISLSWFNGYSVHFVMWRSWFRSPLGRYSSFVKRLAHSLINRNPVPRQTSIYEPPLICLRVPCIQSHVGLNLWRFTHRWCI